MREVSDDRLTETVTFDRVLKDGGVRKDAITLLKEYEVALYVNEDHYTDIVCTCTDIHELCVGRLFCDGWISSVEDIKESAIDEEEGRASFRVKADAPKEVLLRPVRTSGFDEMDLYVAAGSFAAGLPVHDTTFAAHCAMLIRGGNVLYMCEDISRHNALDKAIGYMVSNRLSPEGMVLFSSGRMPTDMIRKAVIAGIATVAGKAMPTADSVVLAKKYGITLIGRLSQDGYVVLPED